VRGVAGDFLPEGAAVVGVADMTQFVHAHIVAHPGRRAGQPPVETDAAGSAHAPEAAGIGQAHRRGR